MRLIIIGKVVDVILLGYVISLGFDDKENTGVEAFSI